MSFIFHGEEGVFSSHSRRLEDRRLETSHLQTRGGSPITNGISTEWGRDQVFYRERLHAESHIRTSIIQSFPSSRGSPVDEGEHLSFHPPLKRRVLLPIDLREGKRNLWSPPFRLSSLGPSFLFFYPSNMYMSCVGTKQVLRAPLALFMNVTSPSSKSFLFDCIDKL